MKSIKQQRLEFLQETINYYSEDTDRRATTIDFENDAVCQYYVPETGNKCAIGRHINFEDYNNNKIEGFSVDTYQVFALLPYEVRVLGKEFLQVVQLVHDTDSYWNKDGLTVRGIKLVDDITKRYCS